MGVVAGLSARFEGTAVVIDCGGGVWSLGCTVVGGVMSGSARVGVVLVSCFGRQDPCLLVFGVSRAGLGLYDEPLRRGYLVLGFGCRGGKGSMVMSSRWCE